MRLYAKCANCDAMGLLTLPDGYGYENVHEESHWFTFGRGTFVTLDTIYALPKGWKSSEDGTGVLCPVHAAVEAEVLD